MGETPGMPDLNAKLPGYHMTITTGSMCLSGISNAHYEQLSFKNYRSKEEVINCEEELADAKPVR